MVSKEMVDAIVDLFVALNENDIGTYDDIFNAAQIRPPAYDRLARIWAEAMSRAKEILLDAMEATPEYLVCRNCNNFQGAVYLEKQPAVEVLTWKGAYKKVSEWRKKYAGKMKLSTHPNDSLSVRDIDNILEQWRKTENFIPDVVIVDYADILIADPDATKLDWRNQQNAIWKKLR